LEQSPCWDSARKSFPAFKDLFEGDGFYGVRLYAARDEAGVPLADCRVNGEDYESGASALREYAKTWPPAGFEFRKQYVVLHSVAKNLIRQTVAKLASAFWR
jgi:hypothetical protein